MSSARDIRDQQSDYRQSIEDRFVEFAEQHPDVAAAARRDAEATVRLEDRTSFEDRVNAALKNNPDLGKLGIRKVGVVESITTHAFLHKKNRDLVPKLAAVLWKMRKEGMIERLRLR